MGDHTETVEIDYHPGEISYNELLKLFFNSHNPFRQTWSRQYMSIVFYHNQQQLEDIEAVKAVLEQEKGQSVETEIRLAEKFYLAEAYHQKYYLRLVKDLMIEFNRMYPQLDDFVNSTAAARVNGYLKGGGSMERLREEVDSFGLSERATEKLLDIINGYKKDGLGRC